MGGKFKSTGKAIASGLDPLGINPVSWALGGKPLHFDRGSYQKFMKIVDPLNIVDPMGVLPTSWIAGKKPFTFDKTYGGPINKLFEGGTPAAYGAAGAGAGAATTAYLQQLQQQQAAMGQQQQAAAQQATQDAFNAQQAAAATQAQQIGANIPTQQAQLAAMQPMPETQGMTQMPASANVFTTPNASDLKFGGA